MNFDNIRDWNITSSMGCRQGRRSLLQKKKILDEILAPEDEGIVRDPCSRRKRH
jgi:hypothetical protein